MILSREKYQGRKKNFKCLTGKQNESKRPMTLCDNQNPCRKDGSTQLYDYSPGVPGVHFIKSWSLGVKGPVQRTWKTLGVKDLQKVAINSIPRILNCIRNGMKKWQPWWILKSGKRSEFYTYRNKFSDNEMLVNHWPK